MLVTDLTVEVRNASLARVGQILPKDLVGFKAVLRKNNVGNWSLTLPAGDPMADALRAAGGGIIVTGKSGVILSGPTTSAKLSQTKDDPAGVWEISGVDDSVVLAERLAYPTPSTADLSSQSSAYDTRTGVASTVMYAYVDANIGASAPAARKITGFTNAADGALGSSVTASARFDQLGALLAQIAVLDGLVFDVRQNGSALQFFVAAPADRSTTVRMDIDNNRLTSAEYTYRAPSVTRAIVAGQGEAELRNFVEVSDTDSIAAETAWGRRIEVFKDDRSSATDAELLQTGTAELVEKGRTVEGISVTPTDDLTMAYGTDWGLGDKISVVVGTTTLVKIVTEVGLLISEDGIRIGATVGSPSAEESFASPQNAQIDQNARISNLERNEPNRVAIGTEVYVKNNSGVALTRGTAVYINGANGTNILITKAQANTEATSSKTLGLLKQDLAVNELGYVVSSGLLEGLNTSAATVGDPVWLSPTTAGGIVFGLANKPSAPNHMVYLGVVSRVNSNNGEIFVTVQNGFELDELHNVALSGLANNNVLAYDSATSLWKNETAAQAGLATTTDLASYATVSALNLKAPLSNPVFTGTAQIPTLSVTNNSTFSNSLTVSGGVDVGASSTIINPTGGAILNLKSTNANTNAYIGFYRAGSATRTGYIGTSVTSANTVVINNDDATGAQLSVGTDGAARIWSTDIYNRTYSSGATVTVTSQGTLGRISSATKYKLEIEAKNVSDKILALEPKTWLDKAAFEKQQRYLAAVEAGEDTSVWEGYTTDWVQPRVAGLIAEDLIEAGLDEYVLFGEPDEDGNRQVESIQYERLWVELLPVIKNLKTRVTELESLEARISALEGK